MSYIGNSYGMFNYAIIRPNDADGMTNSVDPDQTALYFQGLRPRKQRQLMMLMLIIVPPSFVSCVGKLD